MDVVIKAENLTKFYLHKHLWYKQRIVGIDGINFEVKKGEIFSFIGPNGSGKTTTIKILLGFIKPTSGTVKIFGMDSPNKEILKKIGYVPEIINLPGYLTVMETLKYLTSLSNSGNMKIDEVISLLELAPHTRKFISELSKGLVQRVAIAQALLHDPELFIFDEPVSGLDPLGIRFMRDFLLTLKSKGKTVFFSSHFISEVEKISDRVAILRDGKLIKTVYSTDFKTTPLEEIMMETLQAVNHRSHLSVL